MHGEPWQRTLWLMVGVQALMSCAFTASSPFLPLYIIQLRVHPIAAVDLWSGAVMSVNFLLAAICSRLADRILYIARDAVVRVLLASLAGIACFTIPQAFARNIATVLALRFGVGMFLGGVLPT